MNLISIKNQLLDKIPFSLKLRLKKLFAKVAKKAEPFPSAERRDGKNQFQAIVFHDSLPEFNRDSGSLRLFEILRIMARRGRVALVPLYLRRNEFYEKTLAENNIEIISALDFQKMLKQEKIDFVVLSRAEVADKVFSIIRRVSPHTKIIFDTVDVHFVRLQREYEITGNRSFLHDARKLKKMETRFARSSDQVWCVTEQDKNTLQNLAPDTDFEIVPNIHAPGLRGKIFAERAGLLFVGNYEHRPNVDAVLYFLDKVFPLIRLQLPIVRFFVVGVNPPLEILERSSKNVIIKGFVPTLQPLLENCRVFVAPLRYGAGMKGKIGQALSFGLPTVTTGVGAEGMNLTHEREVLIADDPKVFAAEICRVYQDEKLWQTLSDAGFDFIKANFSPEIVEAKIQNALRKMSDARLSAQAANEFAASNRKIN